MFLPKFIHILSTKTAKCAIYKANFFAFNGISTHVHTRTLYIKTNNKLYLQPYNVGFIPKLPPLQNWLPLQNNHHYKLSDLSFSCSCVLCCVSYTVADIWMMIHVLSLPVRLFRVRVWYVWILFECGYIRYMIYSLYSVFYYLDSCTTLIGHYIGSAFVIYGSFCSCIFIQVVTGWGIGS